MFIFTKESLSASFVAQIGKLRDYARTGIRRQVFRACLRSGISKLSVPCCAYLGLLPRIHAGRTHAITFLPAFLKGGAC